MVIQVLKMMKDRHVPATASTLTVCSALIPRPMLDTLIFNQPLPLSATSTSPAYNNTHTTRKTSISTIDDKY